MKPALLLLALVIVPHATAGEPALRGKLVDTLHEGHYGHIKQIAFSPDGKYLASACSDSTVILWDVARRAAVTTLRFKDGPHALAFSADGKSLAVAVGNTTVSLHEVPGGKNNATLKTKVTVFSLAFSPDGQSLAVRDRGQNIDLWNLARGTVAKTFTSGNLDQQVAFSPDGRTLIQRSAYGIDRWDVATGKQLGEIAFPLSAAASGGVVFATAFSPDSKTAVMGGGTVVVLLNAENGKEVKELLPHAKTAPDVTNLALSPDGRRLAVAGYNTIRLLDVPSAKVTATIKADLKYGRTERAYLTFSPDGKTLAGVTTDFQEIALWDATSGELLANLRRNPLGTVERLTFSRDGKLFAMVTRDSLDVWESAARKRRFAFATAPVAQIRWFADGAFSPDGSTFALGASNSQESELFDTANGKVLGPLPNDFYNRSVAFSPDGKTLATGDSKGIKLWGVASRKQITAFPCAARVTFLAFGREGTVLAAMCQDSLDDPTFVAWDVRSGKKLADFALFGPEDNQAKVKSGWERAAVALSPDGKTVACGGASGTVKLWDAATGKRVGALKAHEGRVWSLAFSADGKVLASGGADALVKLWDVASRKEVGVLRGHPGPVTAVAFSPTHPLVVVGSGGVNARGDRDEFWRIALYVWELSPANQ